MALAEQHQPEPLRRSGKLAATVGARIRVIRKQRGLTLLELARRCGTTPQTTQRLESANMTLSLDWLELIADALGVEPHQLFCDDALGKANAAALQAQMELAALRNAIRMLCQMVDETVPGREMSDAPVR
jgi:transcriptional regulator with XRE-family HTH domain